MVFLKVLNQSRLFDIIGVLIVILTAYFSGYIFDSLIKISLFSNYSWAKYVPFGIISVVSSSLSILSTRLTARLNKYGNILGTFNTALSGVIDFLLGNKGAILTYPISFIVNAASIKFWARFDRQKVHKISDFKMILPLIIVSALVISLMLNYFAFQRFTPLYWLSSAVFGLSLIPNLLNVLKIQDQWLFWIFYNLVQLVKAITQGNFANVGKYIYYIINSAVAYPVWRDNRNQEER